MVTQPLSRWIAGRPAGGERGAPPQYRATRNAPPKRGISVEMGCVSRPLNLLSVKDADRQPLVTTGGGVGYLPSGALPIGALPTGGGGGGGCLTGISAAAAALSIAKDAASAVRIFSMMYAPLKVCNLVRAEVRSFQWQNAGAETITQ
jgi:hypothetical protein